MPSRGQPRRIPPCGQPRSSRSCSLLPPFVLFGRPLEALERVRPEAVEVVAELGDACRVDAVDPPGAVPLLRHESRLLEDAEVLRDGGPADRELAGVRAPEAMALATAAPTALPRRGWCS